MASVQWTAERDTTPERARSLLAAAAPARADVRLPKVISDHMVLQRDAAVPLWGWADPDEEVTVTVAGLSQTAKAGADGKWTVKLERLEAGGPHTLTVKGKNTLTVEDMVRYVQSKLAA